jgi:hypothetical protein
MQHLVCCPEMKAHQPVTFYSAGFGLSRLSQLDSEIFPPPRQSTVNDDVPQKISVRTLPLAANYSMQMRPPTQPKEERPQIADLVGMTGSSDSDTSLPPTTAAAFREARQKVQETAHSMPDCAYDVVVHPLGTASATPSKFRNGMFVRARHITVLTNTQSVPHSFASLDGVIYSWIAAKALWDK